MAKMLRRKMEGNSLIGGYSPALVLCGMLALALVAAASDSPPPIGSEAAGDGGHVADASAEGGHGEGGAGEGEHGGAGEGEHGGAGEHEVKRFQVAKFDFAYVKPNFIVAVWILYACGAKIFFHWEKYLSRYFPESCLLIIIGVILGIFLYFANEKGYELNTTLFFLVILPPIILDAGYFMPARSFFDQLGTILLYAILGTLLNTLFLGFALWGVYEGGGFKNLDSPLLLLDSLVFASLLAAVDPVAVLAVFESVHVNEILYIIVFGESLLNDGISVVLYHLFEGLSEIGADNILPVDVVAGVGSFFVIVFGAVGIGMLLGLFAGFMSRFTKHVRIMEPLLVFVIGYLSFIVAEMFHLSGIISCTFCGITMRKYVETNFSQKSQTTIRFGLKLAASASETIIFMYIGVSAVSDTHHWDTAFVILTLVFCLIFRALGVIILTYFANLIRVVKLTKVDQFIMAYGGLRGAIAFALAVLLDSGHFKHRRLFITSTVVVVYFTNIAMGSTIKALVTFLKVKRAEHRVMSMGEKIVYRFIDHAMGGIEDITDQKGHHLLRERFSYFNNNYLKPFIVGKKNPQRGGWQILSVYNRINEKAAKKFLKRSDSTPSHLYRNVSYLDLSRTTSISQLFAPTPTNMNHAGFGNWWDSNGSIPRVTDPSSPTDALYPVLDHNVLESQSGRKMKDASRTHHISEDLVFQNRNSRDRLGHVATTPPPHSPAGAVEYGVRPSSFPVAIDEQGSTNGVNGKKVSFADNYQHTGPSEVIQGLPVLPDTEFVNSESDDDMEGGVAMFPEMKSERRQPTELELSLPWKRIDGDSDLPLLSPSRMRLPREFLDQTAADTNAIVEFEIRTPDSDRIGLGLDGMTNLGFADDDDRRSRRAEATMSPSSSSSAASDRSGDGNTNRRGETNRSRLMTGAVDTDESPETRGRSRRQERHQEEEPDAEHATASFEMREITLDPSSLAEATKYPDEDLESGSGAKRRGPWSK